MIGLGLDDRYRGLTSFFFLLLGVEVGCVPAQSLNPTPGYCTFWGDTPRSQSLLEVTHQACRGSAGAIPSSTPTPATWFCGVFPTSRVYSAVPPAFISQLRGCISTRFPSPFHRKVQFLRAAIDEQPMDPSWSKPILGVIAIRTNVQRARFCVRIGLQSCYPFSYPESLDIRRLIGGRAAAFISLWPNVGVP